MLLFCIFLFLMLGEVVIAKAKEKEQKVQLADMVTKIFEVTNELISKGVELADMDSKIFALMVKEKVLTTELRFNGNGVELADKNSMIYDPTTELRSKEIELGKTKMDKKTCFFNDESAEEEDNNGKILPEHDPCHNYGTKLSEGWNEELEIKAVPCQKDSICRDATVIGCTDGFVHKDGLGCVPADWCDDCGWGEEMM